MRVFICADDDDSGAGAGSGSSRRLDRRRRRRRRPAELAESAATWTAVVRLISSFRSFQEATLPVAKPSAQAERRAPMLAILEFHR